MGKLYCEEREGQVNPRTSKNIFYLDIFGQDSIAVYSIIATKVQDFHYFTGLFVYA